MTRFDSATVLEAEEIISRYPVKKSALIPLLHLAQKHDGYVADDAMEHIAELLEITPAEVLGTCSFYEMFKLHPVGKYVVNICTNISCQLMGGEELLHHAEKTLGIKSGGTTEDGMFTIEDVECIAACTEAPCMQVNYRYAGRLDEKRFDAIIEDIREGNLDMPHHGNLANVTQHIPPEREAGIKPPTDNEPPEWFVRRQPEPETEVTINGN